MWESLVGQIFGKLCVLEDSGKRVSGQILWKCVCECGNMHFVGGSYLKDGRSTSCGCTRRQIMTSQRYTLLPENEAAFNVLYRSYVNGSRHRDIEFSLTKEEFKNLTQNDCYYCGKIPAQIKSSSTESYVYNVTDRVDNLKGYALDNCVSCCSTCNRLKRSITVDMCRQVIEFIDKEKEKI